MKATSLLETALHEANDTARAEQLLKGVEAAQSALHAPLRMNLQPKELTLAENKKLSRIKRAAQKLLDDTEEVRLDLDEWLIDYKEARK